MTLNERDIVLESLILIMEKGELSHVVVSSVLDKYDYLEDNVKAFIKRVTEGTIENLISIDEMINGFSKVKVNKMKPLIRTLIRMSVYQIIFMDKIPDSAVCNEAVKLANKHGFRTLGGFVNGLLRNISRNKDSLIDNLGNGLNMPEWIVKHLEESYGKENALTIIEDINKVHPVTIRVRNSDMDTSAFEKVKGVEGAFRIPKGISIKQLPGYEEGYFVVQDAASMMAVLNSTIRKGDFVIDVCAAPGGKTIQALDMGARVLARDISQKKIDKINDNVLRCFSASLKKTKERIITEVFDATNEDFKNVEKADVVIADLPCSGLGVMGRKSDIRHKTKEEDLKTLPDIQKRIIDSIWKLVKKGGVLMYSTCTMNPLENEDMARYIVENYPFSLEYEKQFLPGIDGTDGFYIARLRKN